jgi:hypothetical protein
MKKRPVDIPGDKIFKIKKMKISDQKILQHWTGVLAKISPAETKEKQP